MYILADDMGYNDIGYQSTDLTLFSPTLDALAADGVTLDSFYAQYSCTPSRTSLLSGRYPAHTGAYHFGVDSTTPWGLPLEFRTLPQYLAAAANYSSHIVGKWDVGHFAAEFLPLARGFETHYGYYSPYVSYWSYVADVNICAAPNCFYDLHRNGTNAPLPGGSGAAASAAKDASAYSTTVFGAEAVARVAAHAAAYGAGAACAAALPVLHADGDPRARRRPTS